MVDWLVCRGWSGLAHLVALSLSFSYPFPTPKSSLLYSLRCPDGPYMDGLWLWWVVVVDVDEQRSPSDSSAITLGLTEFLTPFQFVCLAAPSKLFKFLVIFICILYTYQNAFVILSGAISVILCRYVDDACKIAKTSP